MANLTPVIKESFLQFAGAVLQNRALVDSRDCIKPSARQIFYCMYTDKFIHSKPFQKTLKAIGSCFRLYIHGDASAEGVIMRAGQPFAYRYPLVEVEGSYGTLIESESWAAPRYTAARLSPLAEYLFADLDKETIAEWRDNYDNTEQYPAVLPSKGFYNIVNGSMGIGVGGSASIPQYNLKELNEALIKLLWNPDISFDDIYVVPDFATGGILINPNAVKESHKNGHGFACKLRSVVDWDKTERCFVVSEIPYSVYTNTICKELEEIITSEDAHGIARFNDLTGKTPCIKIYLERNANPDNVLRYLYKNTSLESYYGINFTMLENGRFPREFTWKEMLQSHLNHEIEVYTRGYQYDLAKIKARLHIIEGLLKAIDAIDEVIHTIKAASDTKAANKALQQLLSIDSDQAKAILDIKLSRLAHLEVDKLVNEKSTLDKEAVRINTILADETLLKKEIENGLRAVASKFGDARRTKIMSLENGKDEEPTEIRQIQISATNMGNIYAIETSSLYTQKRGSVGAKFKMRDGEYVINTITASTTDKILFFTEKGQVAHCAAANITLNELVSIYTLVKFDEKDKICSMAALTKATPENILFVTQRGLIKKSALTEYNLTRTTPVAAIKLDEGDKIVSILFAATEKIGVLSARGHFIITPSANINSIGRVARGVIGIKLEDDDEVISAKIVPDNTKEIVSITGNGLIKRTSISEYTTTDRGVKGQLIQKLNEDDWSADFLPIAANASILVSTTHTGLKINYSDIPVHCRATLGVKSVNLAPKANVIAISQV